MFPQIKLLFLLVFLADLVLLGVMAHYTSWLFVFGFMFLSFVMGVWVLNEGLGRHVRKRSRALNASELPPQDFLLGTVNRLAAGTLLIVPGVLSDLLALVLLTPAGKWLTRRFFQSLADGMIKGTTPFSFRRKSGQSLDGSFPPGFEQSSFTEKPARDEIIDVKVVNVDEKKEK
jgi:UPF0716 family protein affecting phage T7 exclusion